MSSLVPAPSREGRSRRAAFVFLSLLAAGCSAQVDATNAFDPESSEPARGSLRGRVEAPGRATPAGIEVRLEAGPEPVAPTTTGDDGAFTFGALRAGRYDVVIREAGYAEFARSRDVGIGESLDVGTLALESLQGTEDASFVTGVALLEGRSDHTGVSVTIADTLFRTTTAADGSFVLPVIEGTFTLAFTYPEFSPATAEVTVAKGETRALETPVELRADPAVLTGTILGRDCRTGEAAPLAGATVSPGEGFESAVTAVDGTFRLDLPGGVWNLQVAAPRLDAGAFLTFAVRGGEHLELGELTLEASTGSLSGQARLFERVDHAGTIVQLAGEVGRSTVTDVEGRFRIEQVCEGEGYELRATPTAPGFLPAVRAGLRVVADEETIVETLTLPVQRGGLVLANGDPYAREELVAYSLDAVPGTTQMRFADDEAAIDAAPWTPYVPIGTVLLRAGEGLRTKFAQTSADGATSAVFRAAVIVDRTPPAFPSLVIEGGGALSNDPDGAVQLELVASEAPGPGVDQTSGLAGLQLLSIDLQAGEAGAADPLDPRWDEVVTPTTPYRRSVDQPLLRPNVDEEKELWARFTDAAGNRSAPVSARVTLDRAPPSGAAVAVRTLTPGFTRSSVIDLELTIADAHPGVQVRVANGPDLSGASWQPVLDPPVMTWFLPQIEGVRTIHAQFRDAAGNLSAQVSTSVELDFTSVTGVRMTALQAPYARTTTLDLDLAAQGAVEMSFSLRPDFTDAAGLPEAWVGFATAWAITLPAVDGPYVVYGKFRDAAGNESVPLAVNVTLDTVPPAIAALSLVEGAAVPTADATLSITALPGALDAFEAQVAVVDVASGAASNGPFVPFSPALPVTLPAPPGDKRVELVLRDAAGNVSLPSIVLVDFDPVPPTITSFTIDGGAAVTRESAVTLTIDAVGAEQALVSNRGDFAGSVWQPLADPQLAWSLPAIDGVHTVQLRLRDAAGNEAQGSAQIALDRTAPSAASVTIDLGAGTSRDSQVELRLAATDVGSGLAHVELDTEASFSGALVVPWAGAASQDQAGFPLEPGEGPRTVYARFVDVAGNGTVTAASVTVDTLAPLGALAIDAGADYTLDSAVALLFTAPSDTAEVAIVDGPTPDCAAARQPFAATIPWTLPAGDGPKAVAVCLFDAAGNVATVQDSIVLDSVSPSGALQIASGADFTAGRDVMLSFTASADTIELALANDVAPDCATASYEPFGASRAWQLTQTDGSKSVTACLRDAAGRTALVSDTITLDETAPTATLQLDLGAARSTDSTVAVRITASDATSGLGAWQLRNDVAFAGAATAFTGSPVDVPAHALVAGDGARTVYVRVTDVAGNATIASATLVVDSAAPTGTVAIDGGALYTQDRDVTLAFVAAADVTQLRIVDGATADCTGLVAFAASAAWTVPVGDGVKTIAVCFADAAGNTATATASITLDTANPAGTLAIDAGAATTRDRDVVLTLSGLSADVTGISLADGAAPSCASATYEAPVGQRAWQLPTTDGAKTVGVCFRDAAGRTSSTTDAITLDGTAPAPVTVSIAAGAAYATAASVSVQVNAADATAGLATYELSLDPNFTGATPVVWLPGASVTVPDFTLAATQGLQTVYARLIDAAGNATIASDAITLDSAAPVGTILVDGGAAYTQDRDVVLTLTAPADTTQMRIVDGAVASCAARVAFVAAPAWTVPVGDGVKAIAVCFADAAGNTATATASITLDTANPAGTLAIDAGATTTRDRDVVLTLSGVSADVTGISLADGAAPSCASATYEAPVGQRAWQLPVTDGSKTVGVCFKDAAGRTSSTTDAITLDGTAPAPVTVSIAAGAAYATGTSVSVQVDAADATAGLATYELSLDPNFTGATPVVWLPGASVTVPDFTLAATQGLQTVYARLIDAAGNATIASDAITLDTQDPSGTVLVDGGATYVTSTSVTLTLAAPADTVSYKVVNGAPSCVAPLSAYAASVPHSLTAGDEPKLVGVCFVDAAGRTSTTTATTILDTTSPAGTITIEPVGAYTTSQTVNLRLAAAAPIEMSIADGGAPVCASATYEPFAATKSWTLPAGDGSKTIGVCFRDAAGLTASNTASITLDASAPTVVVSVAAGATFTSTTNVGVGLTFPNDVAAIAIGYDVLDCATASYTNVPGGSVSASTTAAVAAGDGSKVIVACVRDNAGNTGSGSDSIVLDTEPPGAQSLVLAGGAAYTTGALVTAALAASGAPLQMCFTGELVGGSNDSCTLNGWQPFAATADLTLTAGDGNKQVNVWFRDAALNVGPRAFDDILRDGTAPTAGTLTVSGPAFDGPSPTLTRNRIVLVQLAGFTDATSGVTEMQLSEDSAFVGTAWSPLASEGQFTLSDGDELKTVWLRVRDAAGNTTTPISRDITLDTTPPSDGVVQLAGDAAFTTSAAVALSFWVSGDAVAYRIDGGTLADCLTPGCGTAATPETAPHTLLGTDGTKLVRVVFRDNAGNDSVPFSDSIQLDTTAPPDVSILGVDVRTTSVYVDLEEASPSDHVALYRVRALEPGLPEASATVVEFTESQGWLTGLPALIEYNLQVQTEDEAGNRSAWTPTNPQPTLVGMTTTSVDGPTVGYDGQQRGVAWNGLVVAPGYEGAANESYTVHVCDARREPCSTAGFTTSSRDPTPGTTGDLTFRNTLFTMRDELWMVGVRDSDPTGGENYVLDALWTRGTDAATSIASGWNVVALPAIWNWFSPIDSIAAASNGRIAVIAYIQGNQAFAHVCNVSTGCLSASDWTATGPISDVGVAPVEVGSKIAVEAGENQLYVTWAASNGGVCTDNSVDCGVGLAVCNVASTTNSGCFSAGDWTKLRLAHPPGRARGARAVEAEGKLFIASLFEPGGAGGAADGLFLWSCDLVQNPDLEQCATPASFSGPLLLQTLDATANGSTATAPAIAFDYANGSLFYATYDFNQRRTSFGRCRAASADCMATVAGGGPRDWNRSTLYEGDSFAANPQLYLVGGNPVVIAYRNAMSLYVSEPATWAPVRRAFVPDLGSGGVRATWFDRRAPGIDAYGIAFDATAPDGSGINGAPFETDVGIFSPIVSSYKVLQTPGGQAQGLIGARRDLDQSIGEPTLGARGALKYRSGNTSLYPTLTQTDSNGQPRLAHNATCWAVAYVDPGRNVKVSTCPKASACTAQADWRDVTIEAYDPVGHFNGDVRDVAIALEPANARLHVAYAFGDYPYDLNYEFRTIDATCTVSAAENQVELLDGSLVGNRPSLLSLVATDARVFLAFSDDDFEPMGSHPTIANAVLRGCPVGAACTNAANWSSVTFDHAYWSGALTLSGGDLLWAYAYNTDGGHATRVTADLLRCDVTSLCDAAGDLRERHPVSSVQSPDLIGRGMTVRREEGRTLVSLGGQLAWCNDVQADCDEARDWTRGTFPLDLGTSSTPGYVVAGSVGNAYLGAIGELQAVVFDRTELAMARCPGRCWNPDSWIVGTTQDGPLARYAIAPTFPITGTVADFTPSGVVILAREYDDPTASHHWVFHNGAAMDVQ